MNFPNNLNKKSLLNEVNRNEINYFLDKNISKNLLNINFWNQKLIIENYDKEKNKNDKISWKEFSNIINTNSKYKLVLGINSQKSLNKLSKIIDNNDIFDNN